MSEILTLTGRPALSLFRSHRRGLRRESVARAGDVDDQQCCRRHRECGGLIVVHDLGSVIISATSLGQTGEAALTATKGYVFACTSVR